MLNELESIQFAALMALFLGMLGLLLRSIAGFRSECLGREERQLEGSAHIVVSSP